MVFHFTNRKDYFLLGRGMQVLSRAKVAHSFSFCLNKLLSRRPSLFFPRQNPFLILFILKRYCLLCRSLLSFSLPDLWLVYIQPMNSFLQSPWFEPRLCQMWGTLREIRPKERQPFLQVLIFPGKSNQEHWRSSPLRVMNVWRWTSQNEHTVWD